MGNFEADMPDVSCAKIAEPIEMPFGLWTQVGQKKHVLHGVPLALPGKYDCVVATPPDVKVL